MIDITGVFGIALISTALILTVKKHNPEHALAISIGCCCVLAVYLLKSIADVVAEISAIADGAMLEDVDVLFKALGISVVGQILSDICTDYGQSSLSSIVSIASRFTIVILSMPLFIRLVGIALDLASR